MQTPPLLPSPPPLYFGIFGGLHPPVCHLARSAIPSTDAMRAYRHRSAQARAEAAERAAAEAAAALDAAQVRHLARNTHTTHTHTRARARAHPYVSAIEVEDRGVETESRGVAAACSLSTHAAASALRPWLRPAAEEWLRGSARACVRVCDRSINRRRRRGCGRPSAPRRRSSCGKCGRSARRHGRPTTPTRSVVVSSPAAQPHHQVPLPRWAGS
jgi:hypothetical protein